jgi:hypothetical protein
MEKEADAKVDMQKIKDRMQHHLSSLFEMKLFR